VCSATFHRTLFLKQNYNYSSSSSSTRGADKSLARPSSRCHRAESIVSESGFCSRAEFKVFSCYRGWKEVCQATRAISTTWRRDLSSSFFFARQGKAPKEINAILAETLEKHAPSYATVKTLVAQFKRGDFSICVAPRPGRPKTVTIQEIIDQIQELNFEDRRISAKSTAEKLGISRERIGSIIHEDLDMRKLSAKWVPKCPNADQKRQRCQSSGQYLEFFLRHPNDFQSRLATMDETWLYHYDPETKQQSVEWRHSGSLRPKNSECKNPLEKFSSRFFGIKTASPSLIIFQRAKLSTSSIYHLSWCNWRTFWRKNAAGGLPRRSCSCTTMPRLTGHWQPRRNWPSWASSVPITHPILRIWSRRTTACSLD